MTSFFLVLILVTCHHLFSFMKIVTYKMRIRLTDTRLKKSLRIVDYVILNKTIFFKKYEVKFHIENLIKNKCHFFMFYYVFI